MPEEDAKLPPIPRIPRGLPLRLTPDEVEAAANISEGDKVKARAFWRKHAPKQFSDLIDAEKE